MGTEAEVRSVQVICLSRALHCHSVCVAASKSLWTACLSTPASTGMRASADSWGIGWLSQEMVVLKVALKLTNTCASPSPLLPPS